MQHFPGCRPVLKRKPIGARQSRSVRDKLEKKRVLRKWSFSGLIWPPLFGVPNIQPSAQPEASQI